MKDWITEFLYRFGLVKKETVYITTKAAPENQEVVEFKVGDVVYIGHCVGVIDDIAFTSQGKLMVNVRSFKLVARQASTEWLQYFPGMITLATKDQFERDYEMHIRMMEKTLVKIQEIKSIYEKANP